MLYRVNVSKQNQIIQLPYDKVFEGNLTYTFICIHYTFREMLIIIIMGNRLT